MTYDGRLLEVEVLGRGTSATADVAAGGTQVPVEDLTEFSDEGGRCEIAGVQYDYTGIIEAADGTDTEAGSLMLADPLTVDVAEADPVRVVVGDQAATDAWAVIDLGSPRQDVDDDGAQGTEAGPEAVDGPDVGDVVRVPLSFSQRLVYREGVYEPPVPVQVADDLSAVIDVPGVVPVIDGGMIDPDTLPTPPSGPTVPPATSPIPSLIGNIRTILGTFPTVADATAYEVHLALGTDSVDASGNPFTTPPAAPPDATTINVTVTASQFQITKGPDGADLQTGTSYYVAIVAKNDLGAAAPSPWTGPVQLRQVTGDDISADYVYAGTVLADQLQAGDLTGVFALLGALAVGDNISLDPADGLVIHTDAGDMKLPADGSGPQFVGSATLDALTILGNFGMRGLTNQIAKGGALELASATAPPQSSPVISAYYPSKPIFDGGFVNAGLAYHAAAGAYLRTESVFSGGIVFTHEDADGFTWANTVSISGDDGWGRSEVYSANGGVAVIGTNVYVLCHANAVGSQAAGWYVYKGTWDGATFNYSTRWPYEPTPSLGSGSPYRPAIGVKDSTGEIVIAQRGGGSSAYVWVSTYSTAGVLSTRVAALDANGDAWVPSSSDLVGCGITAADFGIERIYVAGGGSCGVFDTGTHKIVTADTFPLQSGQAVGIMWDTIAGRFRSCTDDTVYDHSAIKSAIVAAVQTWRKANITAPAYAAYETSKSEPSITTAFKKRAWLRLSSAAIPDDDTDPNDPDAVTFYIATDATGTNTSYHRQPPPPAGETLQTLGSIDTTTAAPPTTSTFPVGPPAQVHSDAADGFGYLIDLYGDGSFRLGALSSSPPYLSMQKDATAQALTASTWTAVTGWTVTEESGLSHYGSEVTVQQAGTYFVSFSAGYASGSSRCLTAITLNSTTGGAGLITRADNETTSTRVGQVVSGVVRCKAGDVIRGLVYSNAARSIEASACAMSVYLLGA